MPVSSCLEVERKGIEPSTSRMPCCGSDDFDTVKDRESEATVERLQSGLQRTNLDAAFSLLLQMSEIDRAALVERLQVPSNGERSRLDMMT